MNIIDPCKDKIRIKGVRKRGDGKITIELASEQDLKKVVEHDGLKSNGLIATQSGALNPKVLVYDVPRGLEPDDILDCMVDQNEGLLQGLLQGKERNDRREELKSEFIPRFKVGRKDGPLTSWVIEVSPRVRNVVRSNDKVRLFMKWQSSKVQDYRGVTRCYNCQLYGHVAKYCTESNKVCSFCSITGHIVSKCPDKRNNKNPTRSACKRAKKKADHSINDKLCPAYNVALERIIERTYYGNNG